VSDNEADQIKQNAKASQSSVTYKKDNGSDGSVQIQYKWVEEAIESLLGNKGDLIVTR